MTLRTWGTSAGGILLASLAIAGPDLAYCSSCPEGADETLTLEVRSVVVDGVAAPCWRWWRCR
jgi:hypothetical protein